MSRNISNCLVIIITIINSWTCCCVTWRVAAMKCALKMWRTANMQYTWMLSPAASWYEPSRKAEYCLIRNSNYAYAAQTFYSAYCMTVCKHCWILPVDACDLSSQSHHYAEREPMSLHYMRTHIHCQCDMSVVCCVVRCTLCQCLRNITWRCNNNNNRKSKALRGTQLHAIGLDIYLPWMHSSTTKL